MVSRDTLSHLAWTVRYLKAVQIRGQISRRLACLWRPRECIRERRVSACPGCAWPNGATFLPPGIQANQDHAIRGGVLCFLNRQAAVGFPPRWHGLEMSKLWLYNLHYFEWLWALSYCDARSVVLDWIDRYPPSPEAPGWEPYPTSLRLVNWCAVFWGRFREQTEADHAFRRRLWSSIVRQVDWLAAHLETHLLGNHYFENGAALAFVGSCFHGPRADKWLQKGRRILHEQIEEQILPDGMQFELSPMYHSRIAYVLAMLAATGNAQLANLVREPLGRMLRALTALCHPDGGIALLNDSALGIYNEPAEILAFCYERLGMPDLRPSTSQGCFALPDAGYFGWADGDGNYLVCDCAKVGPDYIPGHAHADIFTFELSLHGQRVIVDAGVHDYQLSPERRCCRSTAAHNTVEIDGLDQCEMWGAFRVARRGRPQDVVWQPGSDGLALWAWHDGYRRLPGRPIHSRRMRWEAGAGLTVVDSVVASRPVTAVTRLHLHPACSVVRTSAERIEVEHPKGCMHVDVPDSCPVTIENGHYYPQFGRIEKNQVIALTKVGSHIELRYSIRDCADTGKEAHHEDPVPFALLRT